MLIEIEIKIKKKINKKINACDVIVLTDDVASMRDKIPHGW